MGFFGIREQARVRGWVGSALLLGVLVEALGLGFRVWV